MQVAVTLGLPVTLGLSGTKGAALSLYRGTLALQLMFTSVIKVQISIDKYHRSASAGVQCIFIPFDVR